MKKLLALFAVLAMAGCACASVVPPPGRMPRPKPPVETALPELTHEHTDKCPPLDTNKVRIVCILDRSGSMSHLTSDTIGGYNSFIEKQRAEAGEAKVTTVLFDNKKLKRLVPGFCCTTRFDQGVRGTLENILAHPELQVPDPEFDAWCDRVIAAMEQAKASLR